MPNLWEKLRRQRDVQPSESEVNRTTEAILFIKEHHEKLKQHTKLFGLGTVLDVIKYSLKEDLTLDPNGTNPVGFVAAHAFCMAQESLDWPANLTNLLVEKGRGKLELPPYWIDTFLDGIKTPEGIARRAGFHPIEFPLSQESATDGGDELAFTLAPIIYENWYNLSILADKPLPSDKEMKPYPQNMRGVVRKKAQAQIETIKSQKDLGKLGVFAKYLRRLYEPLGETMTPDERDASVVINPDTKRFERRDLLNPLVRLIRRSGDPDICYYLDLPYLEIFALDKKMLGGLLESKDKNTSTFGLEQPWNRCTNGDQLWDGGLHSPPFSISSGLFLSENSAGKILAENGNSIAHIDYAEKSMRVSFGHLYADAAKSKRDLFSAGRRVQDGHTEGQLYLPSTLPETEVLPPFEIIDLPRPAVLDELIAELEEARITGNTAFDFRDDPRLLQILKWVGLSNVQLDYAELGPDRTKGVAQTHTLLQKGYTEIRRQELSTILDSLNTDKSLSEKGKKAIIDMLIPDYYIQNALDLSINQAINPTGVNDPSPGKNGLNHKALPVNFDLNNPFSLTLMQNEMALSKLDLPTYKLYIQSTRHWRWPGGKIGEYFGAQSMGHATSEKAARFMEVYAHISRLGKRFKTIFGQTVMLNAFRSAFPNTIERYLCLVPSSFEHQDKNGDVYLKPGYRARLTPQLLEELPLAPTNEHDPYLNNVFIDLTNNAGNKNTIWRHVKALKQSWSDEVAKLPAVKDSDDESKVIKNNLVLLRLIKKMYDTYRTSAWDSPERIALRIFLTSGIRFHCAKLNYLSARGLPR